jgi:predicted GNAT family N-acyltransferase
MLSNIKFAAEYHRRFVFRVDNTQESSSDPPSQEHPYILRGLTNDEEIQQWTEFCASVFAYKKPNAPEASYFANHYYHDPNGKHRPEFVRVAICEATQKIVASVRIFERIISLPAVHLPSPPGSEAGDEQSLPKGSSVKAGGIGEVCTDEHHRRRGLSGELLKDAVAIMEQEQFPISFLHAAPVFFAVYEKFGYQSVSTRWSMVRVQGETLLQAAKSIRNTTLGARPVCWAKDTPALARIHRDYSELRLAGCIQRNRAYWDEYLSQEIKESDFVVAHDGDQVVGWISLQCKGGKIRVRDFGIDPSVLSANGLSLDQLFALLLIGSPPSLGHVDSEYSQANDEFSLLVPTFLCEELRREKTTDSSYIRWEADTSDDDHGWMYRPIGNSNLDMIATAKSVPHWIWPSDSF